MQVAHQPTSSALNSLFSFSTSASWSTSSRPAVLGRRGPPRRAGRRPAAACAPVTATSASLICSRLSFASALRLLKVQLGRKPDLQDPSSSIPTGRAPSNVAASAGLVSRSFSITAGQICTTSSRDKASCAPRSARAPPARPSRELGTLWPGSASASSAGLGSSAEASSGGSASESSCGGGGCRGWRRIRGVEDSSGPQRPPDPPTGPAAHRLPCLFQVSRPFAANPLPTDRGPAARL